jgi:hypothetical protein
MNISPFDFARVLIKFKADKTEDSMCASMVLLLPELSFKLVPLPTLKLVSTPLSRLLLGKTSAKDAETV